MVRCPTQVDLERFLDGSLTVEERSRIQTHHDTCASCQRWLEEARADEDLVPELRRAHGEWSAGAGASGPDVTQAGAAGADEPGLVEDAASALLRYRILRRIGGGGMGVVFEAEQHNPKRKVALKVLWPTSMTLRALRRFEHECEILARLDHPGIAQIVEAGTFLSHGEDVPFFAMELIDGEPLVEWARGRGLSVADRVELLLEVADAVQHAHQKGVVHRDLKPANILVTTQLDGVGRPKVLDFGVARSFDAEASGDTLLSREGEIVGTLPYMSAEQLSGDPLAVDTRTDVYALGVILYELLGGRLPYDLSGCLVPEAIRRVEQARPPPLRSLTPDLHEDLEVIAAKALEKDKERRYASVQALADDLRRHLRHEPIEARRPSALYLAGKFVRRNKVLVAGLALTFATLALGMWTTWNQAERARRAERESSAQAALAQDAEGRARRDAERALRAEAEAREEAEVVRELNTFMQSLIGFDPEDPDGVKRPADTQLLEIALDTERRLDEGGLSDVTSETSMRIALGNFFLRNGDRARGLGNLERAHSLRVEHLGPLAAKTAQASNTLGAAYFGAGRLAEAEERFLAALDGYEAAGDPENDKRVASTCFNLGVLSQVQGDLDAARSYLERAAELHEKQLGPDSLFVTSDLSSLGSVLWIQGERDEALEVMEAGMEAARRGGHEDQPTSINAAIQYGILLSRARRFDEAEIVFRRVLELRREDDSALEIAQAQHLLGNVTRDLGRPGETEALAREAIATFRDHPEAEAELALALGLLGDALERQRRYEEALPPFEEALALHRRHRPSSALIGSVQAAMGHAQLRLGRIEQAEATLSRALAWFERFADHQQRTYHVRALADHGAALFALGRLEPAEGRLREALDGYREVRAELGRGLSAAELLAELDLFAVREERGEPVGTEEVEDLRGRARERLGAGHPATLQVELFHGQRLRRAGELDAAEAVLVEALERVTASGEGDRFTRRLELRLRATLALVLLDGDRAAEALALLEDAALDVDLPSDEAEARYLAVHGRSLARLGRFEDAEAVLLDCLAGTERFAAVDDRVAREVLGEVVALYEGWGRDAKAGEFRARLE